MSFQNRGPKAIIYNVFEYGFKVWTVFHALKLFVKVVPPSVTWVRIMAWWHFDLEWAKKSQKSQKSGFDDLRGFWELISKPDRALCFSILVFSCILSTLGLIKTSTWSDRVGGEILWMKKSTVSISRRQFYVNQVDLHAGGDLFHGQVHRNTS